MATSVRGRPSPGEQGCSGLAGVSPGTPGPGGGHTPPARIEAGPWRAEVLRVCFESVSCNNAFHLRYANTFATWG